MTKTIEDLKTIRAALIERRRTEAYGVAGEYHTERIAKLNSVHVAILALDVVIAEGIDESASVYETRGILTL